ncbi:cytochrome b/b6 domain-containing protein [Microbacterium sp. YY-01]|uniref:cytochrome b/b6 domain-containing protein n=1 Tax=Microbacterium sp. YY-01 TaxID=3421634 RepID=UPI003D165948
MTAQHSTLRRGLPRTAGGEPWPPPSTITGERAVAAEHQHPDAAATATAAPEASAAAAVIPVAGAAAEPAAVPEAVAAHAAAVSAPVTASAPTRALRRGLPRSEGGEPWPPATTTVPSTAVEAPAAGVPDAAAVASSASAPAAAPATPSSPLPAAPTADAASNTAATATEPGAVLRRGLPRVDGGEPWPPAGTTAQRTVAAAADTSPAPAEGTAASTDPAVGLALDETPNATPTAGVVAQHPEPRGPRAPLTTPRTVWQGVAPRHAAAPARETGRRPTWPQAIGALMGAAALALLAGAAIAFVRALLSMSFMTDFLAAYPGEYALPATAEPGIPGWVGWQHFFNMFLMLLIIRSGISIRTNQRPTVFWANKRGGPKISLTIWFHQALDILWLVNGIIFVVLLIVSGHWMRLVPTSWEVFPNALSAALQYVSLDWPTENGWVNYNSLQQIAYFTTVFIAAPLAAITGWRMSGLWPSKAEGLSRAYPVEWARALHFPIMIYFVAFIIVHVLLVMFTGFLRNLNHMFASQDAVTWTGFWVFIAALAAMALGWAGARPLVIAPIARIFGQVSGR